MELKNQLYKLQNGLPFKDCEEIPQEFDSIPEDEQPYEQPLQKRRRSL